jgi:hypothetical protein
MIYAQVKDQFGLLITLTRHLNPEELTRKIDLLGSASIGQHARHIIELWQCALNGYDTGLVDYHNRERNLLLENDKDQILSAMNSIMAKASELHDKSLSLYIAHNEEGGVEVAETTYLREVVYNVEHMIHHMALIKVALRAMQIEITQPNFGMAYSTIQYQAGR